MGLYLCLALVCLEGSLRRLFLCMNLLMGIFLVIALFDLIGVVVNCLALVMLKCNPIHACYYCDLMIELLDYIFNHMICILTLLDLMLLFL